MALREQSGVESCRRSSLMSGIQQNRKDHRKDLRYGCSDAQPQEPLIILDHAEAAVHYRRREGFSLHSGGLFSSVGVASDDTDRR